MKKKLVVFLFAGVLLSCNEHGKSFQNPAQRGLDNYKETAPIKTPPAKDSVKKAAKKTQDTVSFVRKYNDIARFIAGMKHLDGSPYAKLEKDTTWVRTAKEFDKAWKKVYAKRLNPMSKWSAVELAKQHTLNLDVFYPFSGPDILHANAFFDKAKHYHLYALERAGDLPDLNRMNTKETEAFMDAVYASLSDVFNKSYFITHNMLTDLQKQNVNGTLSLICIFLVRTQHTILNVRYFHLNNNGSETPLSGPDSAIHSNDFVKVYFKKAGDSVIQVVSYMKCDLSNVGLKNNVGLTAYFNNLPQVFTYIKSASYLLHYKTFTAIKDIILNKSQTVLEDDTGIPFQSFAKNTWNIYLYGVYSTPVKDFSGVYQTDLFKAYHDSLSAKPKSLPFSLGYHWGTNAQNLMLAVRKN